MLNVNKTEYDATSIISESSHWSTGNGDDENMALVPGTEAILETKDWSTYINIGKSITYNSSDEEDRACNDFDNSSLKNSNKINKKKRIEDLMNEDFDDDDDDDEHTHATTTSISSATATTVINNNIIKRNTLTKDEIDNKKFFEGDSDNTEENSNIANANNTDDDNEDEVDNDSVKKQSDYNNDTENENENDSDDDDEEEEEGEEDNEDDFDDDDIYTIKPKLAKYYEKQFKTMQPDLNDVISGVFFI